MTRKGKEYVEAKKGVSETMWGIVSGTGIVKPLCKLDYISTYCSLHN